jgi:nucleotide-binding universal stress UspA family protein
MAIIYATDFSAPAAAALPVATNLARRLGDSIVVAHVMHVPAVLSQELMTVDPAMIQSIETIAAEQTQDVVEALRAEGLSAEARVLGGTGHEAIADLAEGMQARLVVIGTHGRGAFGRVLLGSFAERLVRSCSRPVLVVPRQARGGLLGRASPRAPLELAVAIDRDPAGEAARAFTAELRSHGPADVSFVHFYDSGHEHVRLAPEQQPGTPDPDREAVALMRNALRPMTEALPGNGRVSLSLRASRGGVADAGAWAALADDPDLLIVGAPPREEAGRARSAIVELVRTATVPVLVVPAHAHRPAAARPLRRLHLVPALTGLSRLGNPALVGATPSLGVLRPPPGRR